MALAALAPGVLAIGVALHANLGTVGDWVSGVVAVGLSASRSTCWIWQSGGTVQRQARLVSPWIDVKTFPTDAYSRDDPPTGPCLYVRNDCTKPIYQVVIQPEPHDPHGLARGGTWATISPGETKEAFWPFWPDEPSDVRPTINFMDASGIVWHRDRSTLTNLSRDPGAPESVGMDTVSPPKPMQRPGP